MKTCHIFCAAGFDGLVEQILPGDLVIAADGGFAHTQREQLQPDLVLGDFDSLGYVPENARVFPVEKDDTDAMLAVRQGLAQGFDRFLLYGSLDGPRLDHTVANFQTLQYLADHGARGWLIGKTHIVTVIQNDSLEFSGKAAGILSVFCMGAAAKGVSIRGAQYELEQGTLTAGFPLGVSNHFVNSPGSVRVADGSLLVIYDRQNGIL